MDRRSQRGFTLVEVLVAVMIMVGATWAAAQGVKGSMLLTRGAMDRLYAAHYAQYWLDYYRHVPFPGDWYDSVPSGSQSTSTRYDSYRKVFYKCQIVRVVPETATVPMRLEVRVTPYRRRTESGSEWVAGGTLTMRTDYYGKARGR